MSFEAEPDQPTFKNFWHLDLSDLQCPTIRIFQRRMSHPTKIAKADMTNTCFSNMEECLPRLDCYQQIYFKTTTKRFQMWLFDQVHIWTWALKIKKLVLSSPVSIENALYICIIHTHLREFSQITYNSRWNSKYHKNTK